MFSKSNQKKLQKHQPLQNKIASCPLPFASLHNPRDGSGHDAWAGKLHHPLWVTQGAFWSLRDALGRELRRASLPEGQPQLVLNLEGLPGGVYFCSIEAGGVERWKGKIIKQ